MARVRFASKTVRTRWQQEKRSLILGACVPLPVLSIMVSHWPEGKSHSNVAARQRPRVNGVQRTSSRGTDEEHADLLGRARSSRAGGALLEALDAGVKVANDILQLLELIFDETHLYGDLRSFVEMERNNRIRAVGNRSIKLIRSSRKRRRGGGAEPGTDVGRVGGRG